MDAARLRKGLHAFDARGEFSEDDFVALRAVLGSALRRSPEANQLLDGLIGVFFERHVLDDTRRSELLGMTDDELGRAVRHRFRQLLADEKDDRPAWHALAAHVRDALAALIERPTSAGFPATIRAQGNFAAVLVEQAVAALWLERGSKPATAEATGELLQRYVTAVDLEPDYLVVWYPLQFLSCIDGWFCRSGTCACGRVQPVRCRCN